VGFVVSNAESSPPDPVPSFKLDSKTRELLEETKKRRGYLCINIYKTHVQLTSILDDEGEAKVKLLAFVTKKSNKTRFTRVVEREEEIICFLVEI
jgi:hypothetical protein